MPGYPLHVPRKSYRGSDSKLRAKIASRNALAARLEAHVNSFANTQTAPHLMLSYGEIAMATSIAFDQDRDTLFSVDAGSGGITMFKGP